MSDKTTVMRAPCGKCGGNNWTLVDGARQAVQVAAGPAAGRWVLAQQAYCGTCGVGSLLPLMTTQCPNCGYADLLNANPNGSSGDGPQTVAQARSQSAPSEVRGSMEDMARSLGLGGVY